MKRQILSDSHKEKLLRAHLGKPRTEETKRKMSKTLKGRKPTEEQLKQIRQLAATKQQPIAATNMKTNTIKVYCSLAEAQRCGFNAGHISECLTHKQKSHKECLWRRIKHVEIRES
jgi:hypothetical protein